MYNVEVSKEAVKQSLQLRKSSPAVYKKLCSIIVELQEHPFTGTGHPELLKHLSGVWSRKLDKKNRVCYTVNGYTITVFVISVLGHYGDK